MAEPTSPVSATGFTSSARRAADHGGERRRTELGARTRGWGRLLRPFLTPGAALRLHLGPSREASAGHLVVGRLGPGTAHLRFAAGADPDHGRCAERQEWALDATARAGGSRVVLRDDACIERGDAACEYALSWTEEPRTAPLVVAGLVGGGAAALAAVLALPTTIWLLAPLPAAIAWILERRRIARVKRAVRADHGTAFRWLVEHARAARAATDAPIAVPTPVATVEPIEPIEPEDAASPSLRQEGEFWSVSYEGTTINLRHSRGLQLLAHLVRYPGRDLHVRELEAMTPSGGSAIAHEAPVAAEHLSGTVGGNGPVLDARAQADYRRRVAELRDELEQAESWHDLGRADRARAELAQLAEQLREAAAGGRRASDEGERLRVAITRRIRSAIALIGKHHPALGVHFERCVTTGYSCSYRPDSTTDASPPAAKRSRARGR